MTRPPVVLLHGLASTFEHNWREPGWVDLLADAGRSAPPLDLPGHGGGPREYGDVVGDLAERIEAIRAEAGASHVDGVGFSIGGRLLLAVAARRPDLFGRLAILGVGSLDREPGGALADAFAAGVPIAEGVGAVLWRLAETAGNDPAQVAAFLRALGPAPGPAELARVDAPVLFVLGERDFGAPLSPALLAALPRARSVELRGTDHFATTSDYRCMEAVLSFLEE